MANNDTKHTPGPWTARKYETSECREIRADSGPAVASTWGHGIDTATEIANANLIAAAPDMLAVLKRASDFLEMNGTSRVAVVEDIRSAIAKAEGRL